VSPLWLVATYLLHAFGELLLSPVGLSAMTKLAPARVASLMMGVWFLGSSSGNFIGGRLAALYGAMPLPSLFGAVAGVGVAMGLLMLMALEEYRRKRDFSKTPEPAGTAKKRKTRERFFCVQKHLASRLHYDLRLEHNGVLLSWAVPKGPSLDPKTKRLAMHVEDHPIDYGEFEGVIPEGYGAGIVMLWDKGTWTPESEDVDAALKKGDLKFTLNGYKLKGSWVLVRTSGRYAGSRSGEGKQSWLLIKHRDEWSGELDITEFAPRSVKSEGDFEDILGDKKVAKWTSNPKEKKSRRKA
jgi:DNA ligase D-like protein (predicted 3'-phosphoesterase)